MKAYCAILLSVSFLFLSCSGGSDDPEPEREGFFTHPSPATSGTIFGQAGLPGTVTVPPRLATLTGIWLYTKERMFKADLNSSGQDKFIVIPKDNEEPKFKLENSATGRTSMSGIEGFAFIKKLDTTFVQVTDETSMMMFAVEKDTYDAMKSAIVKKQNGKIVPNSGGVVATIKQ